MEGKSRHPPEESIVKINFDASFQQITNSTILGIIIQDHEGLIMRACTYPIKNVLDPAMAEASACQQAV
ncbi:hypothetical protein PVK06_027645 [Gossypium arboreum]|uniref:RNase H type-1 domain-containing protein n=1 Tax=Gossypium arboreum TaxID=29729 RepID=A0ABR0P0U3_GOSAR|nr:hypothetical protein PVK06_027645 [Gossypium arboreum]